ncbi:MAG: RNA polymerase sigma factor [Chloroflexota bacterium]
MNTYIKSKLKTEISSENIDWEEVYVSCLPRVFHFFCFKVGVLATAEELTSMTFEKAWSCRKNYRQDHGHINAWIIGIARKVAVDYFRQPRREVPLDEAVEIPALIDVEEDVQKKMEFHRLALVLSRLSNRERELIALKYGVELTNREISRITGISESNVGTILHRVVGRIRLEWEQQRER